MTVAPPPYPRTPHLWRPADREVRAVLTKDEADRWLGEPVVVEEKLDGANVSVWWDDGPHVASRGGAGAMDRAGQLGRLRAWVSGQTENLNGLLSGGWVLYGEWLWLRHGVAYDQLPDWFITIDLWHPEQGFAPLPQRDIRSGDALLSVPPRLFSGVLADRKRLMALLGRSRFSSTDDAEGLILRSMQGRRCKLIASGYRRRDDQAWEANRENNSLRPRGTAPIVDKRSSAMQ